MSDVQRIEANADNVKAQYEENGRDVFYENVMGGNGIHFGLHRGHERTLDDATKALTDRLIQAAEELRGPSAAPVRKILE